MVKSVKTEEEFQTELDHAKSQGRLVVVDFFAEWCGPCKVIAPKLEEMSKSSPNVVFLKVDVDQLEGLAQAYHITAMPTLIIIKGGEKVAKIVGANLPELKGEIEKHSQTPAHASA